MTDHYDQREALYEANQQRAAREQRDALPGHSNDLRTPDAVAAMLTLPVVELPMELPQHTGEHSHFHSVTDGGAHTHAIHDYQGGAHSHGVPVALGHPYPFGAPMAHDLPGLHRHPAQPMPVHVDTWPSDEPLKTRLRARVFFDGSLVIDNPARPLVVRPMRPDDMNGYTEEWIECEVHAEAFIRAAMMLAQAMGERA